MNLCVIKCVMMMIDDDGNDVEMIDMMFVYVMFVEDVIGFFGKWNL